MKTTLPTDRLAMLIARKHEVLVQLRQAGLQQIDLIQQGDVPTLLRVLALKQQLITDLQNVEQELSPYRHEDPQDRAWPSPQARAECAQLAATCNELLSEIVCLEKQSEDQMVARRDQVAHRLQQMYSAAQARGAYAMHQAHGATGSAKRPHHDTRNAAAAQSAADRIDLVSDK